MGAIIPRYLATEVVQHTIIGFLAAAPVVLLPNVFDRAGEFMVSGITADEQWDILSCVIPLVVAYALPISFMFGVMMAIGRLSGDLEIDALRSCGFGTIAILAPIALLGVAVSALTAYLMIEVEPRAKRELAELSVRLAARGGLIEEGSFTTFGRRMIYVQNRADHQRLEGVMISDRTNRDRAFHIFAETARFSFEYESGLLHLVLQNGDLRMDPGPGDRFDGYRISFSQFDYTFRVLAVGEGRLRHRTSQLSLGDLREAVARIEAGEWGRDLRYRRARIYSTQIHRLLAIPLAPALFAMVGVSLGLRGLIRSRARGMLLALMVLATYYMLFFYVQDASLSGHVPPALAIWTPNAILVALAAGLFWNSERLR